MFDGKLVWTWLGISSFVIITGNLVCGDQLTSTGDFISQLTSLLGYTTCAGIPAWLEWALSLFIVLPGLMILASWIIPVLAGAASNSIVGTIISVAVIVTIVGLVTTWLV